VRLPRQARSRATFDQILAAAEALLRDEGLQGVTVQAILERTGIGAGSFYARFDSHEALLRFMALRFWGEAEVGWAEFLRVDHWKSASVPAIVHAFIGVLVRWNSKYAPELKAHLSHAMAEAEGNLLDEMADVENTVADYLVDLTATRLDEIDTEDPEDRVRLATLQVFSTLRSRIIFARDESTAGISDKALVQELSRAFLLHIGARPT